MSHPLIRAMIDELPVRGSDWPNRAQWESLFSQCLDLVYPESGKPAQVKQLPKPDPVRASASAPVEKIDLRKDRRPRQSTVAPPWTEQEFATLRDVILRRGSAADAKAALPGRGAGTVQSRYYTMKREMRAKGELREAVLKRPNPAQQISSETVVQRPVVNAPVSAPIVAPEPAAEAASYSDKAVLIRLRNLGHVDPWSPELDVELVELLLTGTKVGAAAEILEIPKDECVARFKRLCPDGGIDAQRQVLRLLKAQVSA